MSYLSYKLLAEKRRELALRSFHLKNLCKNSEKSPDLDIRLSYWYETYSQLMYTKQMQDEFLDAQLKKEVPFAHLFNIEVLLNNKQIQSKHGFNSITPIETMYCLCDLLTKLNIDLA